MSMSCTKLVDFASAGLGLLALAGCTAPVPAHDQTVQAAAAPALTPGLCDAAAAQRLIGKAKPSEADAMRLTGASLVRQIRPGDAVTHDLRDNRVTVETDPASGRVTNAICG
ncbi:MULTISPECIES: I78 family peptidase inhibitor [unclassified Novosphingobium]|uniref:I78 family peptidase inhibitor n=1 Tax=unclassified Novosphingobium TaxID=2644732 RepID=UPI00190F7EA2|nr:MULTISPECIES: I78 family peptidase inhibitor [unclassified Novosphingobium]